jgi:fructosamine-3-kinase
MSRRDIYYWKCDRPAAFHGTQAGVEYDVSIASQLRNDLRRHFNATSVELKPGGGQGNHLTWNADVDGLSMFVRVENGPERDNHLEVESAVMEQVRAIGVPVPKVHAVSVSRNTVDFAWQALERIAQPDLNYWYKQASLDVPKIGFEIGAAVAAWQGISAAGYGPFDLGLHGHHARYEDYFFLRLDRHLHFLVERGFLSARQRDGIAAEIEGHRSLLKLQASCLVHKDLALWNVLGSRNEIAAFIDFDDCIGGDPMDDLSLLACFHDTAFLNRAFEGYQSLRPFPGDYLRRFWLHLLRNMIVKAVIRVGAGHFERTDGFFLIGAGASGADLRAFTTSRLELALKGLRAGSGINILQIKS